jgi:copper(I)-binding protein
MRPILLAALLTGLAGVASAQTPATPATARASAAISVTHAWARATTPMAKTAAAYFTVTDGGAADRITGATTPVAETAELHRTTDDNGVMRMRPVEGGLAVPQGGSVTLSPGGYHLMLTGLKQPLKSGESFPVTLTFAHAAPVTVQVHVQSMGGGGGMAGMQMGK